LIGALIPDDALGTRTESTTVPLPVLPTLCRLDDLDQAGLLVSTHPGWTAPVASMNGSCYINSARTPARGWTWTPCTA
jgi:hypothetical protein